MLKLLSKYFVFFYLLLNISIFPVAFGFNDSDIPVQQDEAQMQLIQKDVRVDDADIEPIDTQKVKKAVVPDSKKEGKKVLTLFLRTMCAVLVSALIIYIVSVIIKRYYGSAFAIDDIEENEDYNLSTPNSKEEALKSFLNRTR